MPFGDPRILHFSPRAAVDGHVDVYQIIVLHHRSEPRNLPRLVEDFREYIALVAGGIKRHARLPGQPCVLAHTLNHGSDSTLCPSAVRPHNEHFHLSLFLRIFHAVSLWLYFPLSGTEAPGFRAAHFFLSRFPFAFSGAFADFSGVFSVFTFVFACFSESSGFRGASVSLCRFSLWRLRAMESRRRM